MPDLPSPPRHVDDASMVRRRKVLAYLTSSRGLLVFRQPASPDAGLQVPAGTVEPGEDPVRAVLRELWEETGLRSLDPPRLLGRRWVDMRPFGKAELHHRSYFALSLRLEPRERWRHWERHSSEGGDPIAYDLSWHDLRQGPLPDLAAGQGALLPRLRAILDPLIDSKAQRHGSAMAMRR